jgi:MFS family permease
MEILPRDRRFLLAMLSLFQPIGVLVASGIAYGFIPKYSCGGGEATGVAVCTKDANMGWRYYLYTCGALTFFIFFIRFAVFAFQESPAYLINRGMDREALASVSRIAKMNKHDTLQFGMDDFEEIDRRCGRSEDGEGPSQHPEMKQTYWQALQAAWQSTLMQLKRGKLLFINPTMARTTILLWLTYFADYFGFSIAGVYLPLILRDRGIEANVSLSQTYQDYIAVYAPGIAACLLGAYMIELPKLGRQWSMVVASSLMAVSMFTYTTVNSQAASVGLNALEYFMQSLFNSILYAYTPAVYPSAIRGSASGITSGIGRIAAIIAPIAAGHLYGPGGADAARNTLFLGGGITLLCPVALALLPRDTGNQLVF